MINKIRKQSTTRSKTSPAMTSSLSRENFDLPEELLAKCEVVLQIFTVLREQIRKKYQYIEMIVGFIDDYVLDIGYVFQIGPKIRANTFSDTDKACLGEIVDMQKELTQLMKIMFHVFTELIELIKTCQGMEDFEQKEKVLDGVMAKCRTDIEGIKNFRNLLNILDVDQVLVSLDYFLENIEVVL